MPISKNSRHLVCPVCKVQVTLLADGWAEMRCAACYPVRDDIPVMLREEATIVQVAPGDR